MSQSEIETDSDRDTRRRALWLPGLLAGVLAVGTTVGIVQAVNSSGTDRVAPSSTAPVYGTR